MAPIFEFMEKAKGLTKNPLGIIALFVSLIYGFACLVLSSNLKNLQGQNERLPLIWFIIIFPGLILIGFIYLVVNHHEKLYAPSDYRDEANFVKTLDARIQVKRIQSEVESITKDIEEQYTIESKEIKKQNEELDKKIIQNKYLIAEELALRAFEQDRKISIKRQRSIVGLNNASIAFDGIAIENKDIYGIDVKYTVHRHLSKTLKERIIQDTIYYSRGIGGFSGNFKLVFLIVTDSNNCLSLESEMNSLIDEAEISFEYIIYTNEDLKRRFGVE